MPASRAIGLLRRAWFRVKESAFLRLHRDRAAKFAAIYRGNLWKNPESASGFGSTLAATGPTRERLERLIEEYRIGSILDAPCGDFNWMRTLRFDGLYTGMDIVPVLVERNRERHGNARRSFLAGDIVVDALPAAEMVLSREGLNHLPLADAAAALERLAAAATRILVVTHYPALTANGDQPASFRYRPLNLTAAPFGWRQPDRTIDEAHFEPGKVLGVWDLAGGAVRQPALDRRDETA